MKRTELGLGKKTGSIVDTGFKMERLEVWRQIVSRWQSPGNPCGRAELVWKLWKEWYKFKGIRKAELT